MTNNEDTSITLFTDVDRTVEPGFYIQFVVGVDLSDTVINEARRRTEGLDLPLTFEVGDAQARVSPMARSTPCGVSAC